MSTVYESFKKPEAIIGLDKLLVLQHLRNKDGLSIQNHETFFASVAHAYSIQPRDMLEQDPTKVHLISYDIIKNTKGQILTYKRPDSNNGEALLTGKRSMGIGGHVEGIEAIYGPKRQFLLAETMAAASQREADEEVKWTIPGITLHPMSLSQLPPGSFSVDSVGFLIEWDKVGLVHLGVVRCYTVRDDAQVVSGEDQLEDVKFETPEDIVSEGFEGWSKILSDNYVLRW